VKNKIIKVLFPFLSRKWNRIPSSEMSHAHPEHNKHDSKFASPFYDENAPDLYLPAMAFITYILLLGLLKGYKHEFTPDVLISAMSNSFFATLLEVIIIKVGLYVISSDAPLFDVVSYSSYKYVGMILNALIGLMISHTAYYVVFCYTSFATAYFVANTLMPVIRPEEYQASSTLHHTSGQTSVTQRNYLVLGAAILQFVMMWFLGSSSSL
jgi:hypothetical protein